MLFVASARSLVTFIAFMLVIVLVLSIDIILDHDTWILFCVLTADYSREGLMDLILLFFYCVNHSLRFYLSFYWFWEWFFRGLLILHLINLLIIYPIPSIFQFTILLELPKAMPIVIFKISCVRKIVLIINFTITAFFIVFILSSILYLCFIFFKVALSMPKSVRKLALIIIPIGPVILSFSIGSIFLIIAYICFSIAESLSPNAMF